MCRRRYLYVCQLDSVGALADDFLHAFLTVVVFAVPAYVAGVTQFYHISRSRLWYRSVG